MNVVIVLVILGALYLASDGGSSVPADRTSADGIGPSSCGGVGGFVQGHVDRKNAVAPTVISRYTGLPGGTSRTIANIADKLSPSAYAERYIGDKVGGALCNLDPLSAAAAGAKFVGKEALAGAEYLGGKAAGAVTNPLSTFTKVSALGGVIGNKIATSTTGLVDRGTNWAYGKLPAPLKVAAAPLVVTTKLASSFVNVTAGATNKAGSAIASGAKSAEHAVSSGVNKVLGYF